MLGEGLPPRVEHGGDAEGTAEVPRIAAKAREGGGRRLKEQAVDHARVALGQRVQGVGQREDDVEVGNGQDLAAPGGEPAFGGHALALRAVAVPAGVVGDPFGAARRADGAMAAEHGGAARGDGAQGSAVSARQRVGLLVRRAVGADDVGELDAGRTLDGDPHGGGAAAATAQAVGGSGRSRGEPVSSTRSCVRWR